VKEVGGGGETRGGRRGEGWDEASLGLRGEVGMGKDGKERGKGIG